MNFRSITTVNLLYPAAREMTIQHDTEACTRLRGKNWAFSAIFQYCLSKAKQTLILVLLKDFLLEIPVFTIFGYSTSKDSGLSQ